MHFTDSIVRLRKDNPDAYYDVHSFLSKDFLYREYYDLSIDEAVKLQKRAQETEHVQRSRLGLSICRIIAGRFGGTVCLDPLYTTGARFVFIHPCEINGESYNQEIKETD